MAFWRKILYYMLGVVLGIFVVQFLFGWRDDIQCNYFPNDRVLYDMRLKERQYAPAALHQMQDAGLDTADISMLLQVGKVDFDRRDYEQHDSCKTYFIAYQPENKKEFTAEIVNCDSIIRIRNIFD